MSLPITNEEIKYIKKKLPDCKTIGVRPWKVKDEKDLMFALEQDENIEETRISHIIQFLRNCVDDKNKFDTVSENAIKKICIETRNLSKGEFVEYVQTCPHCGFQYEDSVDITKEQTTKEFDQSPVIVNDSITITFKDLDWKTSEELFKKYNDRPKAFEFYFILNSIDSFTIDGTTYTEFTPEEAEKYLDDKGVNIKEKVYAEFYTKQSVCELTKVSKCFRCKKEFNVNYGDLLSFLVL